MPIFGVNLGSLGFIGLVVLNPLIIRMFDAPVGLNVLNGALLLALMSVPIIVSIGEDALKAVPDTYREAAEAMGATRWQVVWRVLLPAARNGLNPDSSRSSPRRRSTSIRRSSTPPGWATRRSTARGWPWPTVANSLY